MKKKMKLDIENLLTTSNEHVLKLQEIVKKSLEDETLINQNLLNPPKEILTRGQSISDKVARFGGSWAFIISFFVILTIWIFYNVTASKEAEFDPYPFILMNLILSCIAALQAPVIMMSQNRQEEKDRKRSENDYLINLKAELEVRSLNEKMDLLVQEQIKLLFEIQVEQMKILSKINESLPK